MPTIKFPLSSLNCTALQYIVLYFVILILVNYEHWAYCNDVSSKIVSITFYTNYETTPIAEYFSNTKLRWRAREKQREKKSQPIRTWCEDAFFYLFRWPFAMQCRYRTCRHSLRNCASIEPRAGLLYAICDLHTIYSRLLRIIFRMIRWQSYLIRFFFFFFFCLN